MMFYRLSLGGLYVDMIDDAWACVRGARDADWRSNDALSMTCGDRRLDVRRGGAWRCDGAVPDDVRDLLDCLLPLAARARALVVGQLGQSLDGRIATVTGSSHYVNGTAGRIHLHRLRALVDAVVVGAGTVDADDPHLTVRHVAGGHPLRVVLDPRARLSAERRVFVCDEAATLHLVGGHDASAGSVGAHVERVVVPVSDAGGFEPRAVLDVLAARGLRRVLIEGGGVTVSRFLEARVLHRLHLLVAPLLIGSGPHGIALPPIETLDRALRPAARTFRCGQDTLFDLALATAKPGHQVP